MIDKVNGLSAVPEIGPKSQAGHQPSSSPPAVADSVSFEDLLQSQLGRPATVRFSAHAQKRIAARNIGFSGEETVRLEQAVEKAAGKGSRESLILMDDLALVVSIKNKVVITAVDANNRKENVFTNIDSVVLT